MIPPVIAPLFAALVDRVPSLAFGLPLMVVASIVFAATHHEDPAAIRRATLEWLAWLGGTLGVVLVAVVLVSRLV